MTLPLGYLLGVVALASPQLPTASGTAGETSAAGELRVAKRTKKRKTRGKKKRPPAETPETATETPPQAAPVEPEDPDAALGTSTPAEDATPELTRATGAVLVLDLEPVGVSQEAALALTAELADTLAARGENRVMTYAEVNDVVQYQKDLGRLGCQDQTCVAELATVANAPLALSGSVGEVGGQLSMTISLLDVESARVIGRAARNASSIEALRDLIPELLAETFGWSDVTIGGARYSLPTGQALSFAVFDLRPLGVTAVVAQNLTQILAAEIKRVEGTSVVSRDDIASMLQLQAEKSKLDCDEDMACLAEIGGALGVDKLVVGSAGKVAESYVVSLQLIDARSSAVDSRTSESFVGVESQLMPAVRHAGRLLLGLAAEDFGSVAISATEQEAEVFFDERSVGALPLPPVEGLRPGRHTVRISKDGFVDWQSDVYVEPAGTTALWAEVMAEPTPWYRSWWFWTLVTGAVVAGTVGTILGVELGKPRILETPTGDVGFRWAISGN